MHSMTFHAGVTETVLFDGWRITNWQGMGWSMVGIVLLSAIYESIKSYRDYLFKCTMLLRRKENTTRTNMLFSDLHFFQIILHVWQMILGYFLMLIFMTFNVWLCLAIALGTAFGYWLFSWEKSNNDNTECCT